MIPIISSVLQQAGLGRAGTKVAALIEKVEVIRRFIVLRNTLVQILLILLLLHCIANSGGL